jgi:ribose 5-phosphate isomerase B
MKIALAADHAGFELKELLLEEVRELGYEAIDLGTHSTMPVDYPDTAKVLGESLVTGKAERGILICGSGIGAVVAVNKIKGIRGGLCHDSYSAHQGVEHDDMNVMVLGSRVIGPALAKELVSIFLGARFSGEERHRRRLEKVKAMEN